MSTAKSKRPSMVEYSPDSGKGRSKKRRLSGEDHEEDEERMANLSKMSSVGKMNGLRTPAFTPQNKPAELFRKDLISAMKLPDSEQLQAEEYLLIQDPWRQDWEKGVQVPVNSVTYLEPNIKVVGEKPKVGDFKIPRKFLHASQDETYKQGIHELTGMQQLSEQVVRYDLDDLDTSWLSMVNEERVEIGEICIHEWTMERVMEDLEKQCHEVMDKTIKTEEGLGIEYDEDVICDVCRSPESEENNEMVFCDGCDICVHQACYGIQTIPEGSWLCRTCALGIKPTCILCPKTGGAMKSTKSGTKWSHVSCALWIPEVSIGCVEKMEPITKISQIPVSRWALVCCLCKERTGACIQCSVKACKIAFHVTCAISHNLDMKTILDDSDEEDGVKLKAFCPKHTKGRDRSSSDSELDSPTKDSISPRKDLTNEEREGLRKEKLKVLEDNFFTLIDVKKVSEALQLPQDVVDIIFHFWKLKRKSLFDKPFLTPKTEEADFLEKQQEDSLMARMKMFVHLRQDLERVRNLCYMVSRREKMERSYQKAKESVFMAQVKVLNQANLSVREIKRVCKLYYDQSCYAPVPIEEASISSDDTANINKDNDGVASSRDGTPLSSYSITSDLEIRKSSRRRILSPKLREMSPAFSEAVSQESSISVGTSEDFSGYESDQKTPVNNRRKTLPLNGKLSLSRRRLSRNEQTILSDNSPVNNCTSQTVNETSKPVEETVNMVSTSEDSESIYTRSSPNTVSYSRAVTPEDQLVNGKMSSPQRRVKSRFSRARHSSSLQDGGHKDVVRKTRQSHPHSPESVENKPAECNGLIREVTPGKHKQFGTNLAPSNLTNGYIKKDLKEVLEKTNLVIDSKLREEVQERLLKSTSPKLYLNGRSPRRISSGHEAKRSWSSPGLSKRPNSLNQALTPTKLPNCGKVLNEISPTYSWTGLENKEWYGTKASPRGSLSGYKIPKKSGHTPIQSPVDKSSNISSPIASNVLETRVNIRRRIDAELNKVIEQDRRKTRSRESTPEKIDRRLTRSHGHENIEDVISIRSREIDSLQMWPSV